MNTFTDWQPFVLQVIQENKPKTIFEFGLGEGTELFLDNCEKVYSLELLANPELQEWYDKMGEKYLERDNWKSYLFKCEDKMTGVIKMQVGSHLKRTKPDLVFVDPGVQFRGELVNICFKHKVPLVIAHDTNYGYEEENGDAYGWGLINPDGYETVEYQQGQGTILWKLIQ